MVRGKRALLRGVIGKCPNCGQGKLFKSYIKQNEMCSVCHEDLSYIHADDGPPWLTIFVCGHLLAPLLIYFISNDVLPESVETVTLIAVALMCVFLILPRSKGLFIAAIWLTHKKETDNG